ncbi:unnamed protein product [Phytophthora lilii]|uniref:Unnamed protein product n=1 Tax=Phytophthora lilii TaxID=2077276 RepID=A0A9W6WVT6_9STRA|nr:unnamed protein product [Phytophthora lilii]
MRGMNQFLCTCIYVVGLIRRSLLYLIMTAKTKKAANSSHRVKVKPTTEVVKVRVHSTPPSPVVRSPVARPTAPPPTPTSYEQLVDLLAATTSTSRANRRVVSTVEATMWNISSQSDDLPHPGAIVTINEYSHLKLYRDIDCQATVKLRDLEWGQQP